MRSVVPGRSGILAAALAALAGGCAEELGPIPLKTTRVSGVVRLGNQPIRSGWVEFLPTQGTVGNLRSAPIGPDGSFEADRVAVGKNTIGVAGAPLEESLSKLFHPFRSPIVRSIPGDRSARLDIDLIEEWVRHRKSEEEDLARRPRPGPDR